MPVRSHHLDPFLRLASALALVAATVAVQAQAVPSVRPATQPAAPTTITPGVAGPDAAGLTSPGSATGSPPLDAVVIPSTGTLGRDAVQAKA